MRCRPRRLTGNNAGQREIAVLRHEHVVGDNAAAARSSQPHDIPVVPDHDVACRHQQFGGIDDRAALVGDLGAQQQPVRMLTARRERPKPVEPVAARDRSRLAARRDDGANDRIRVGAIAFRLGLLRKRADEPAMRMDHPHAPRRRAAAAGDFGNGVDVRVERHLEPAAAPRLQHLEEAGRAQFGDIGVGQPAQLFRLGRTRPQRRHEGSGARHQLGMIGHNLFLPGILK